MDSIIKDPSLAPAGEQKIEWVKRHMKVLEGIAAEFARERPFDGLTVALSIHLEAKTAYLAQVLHQGGAGCSSPAPTPLHPGRRVRGLGPSGVTVFATHGCTQEEYRITSAAPCPPSPT